MQRAKAPGEREGADGIAQMWPGRFPTGALPPFLELHCAFGHSAVAFGFNWLAFAGAPPNGAKP